MAGSTELPNDQHPDSGDDDLSVLDLLIVLVKHKKLVLGVPFAVAVLVAGYSLLLPNIYTGTAKILPPQQAQSAASAFLAQLGGFGGLVSGAANLKGPNDVYVAMLKSRTVADSLIQRFGLMKRYEIDPKHPSDAYKVLAAVTNIGSGKDGIITIEVDDEVPARAAELANAYVDELIKFTSVLAVTEASQRRLFFERQFNLAKENLAKAEAVARQALQTGGLVMVDEQGRTMVEATARLRGQITVKEVQIGAMRTFAADNNPDIKLAQQELESMKRQLAKIEGGGTESAPKKGMSTQGMDNLRYLRDVKYHQVIFELLAKQYEIAKIDEAKDSAVVQVMDNAIEPDRKSKPMRTKLVLIWTLVAGLVAVLLAFFREALAAARSDHRQAARLQAIKQYLAWR